ncbi:LysR family transcriptional regulator [Millisia brevis]|uniref:LysR family transcriptional regulator n=1 Tax=Millisia brevis TaxID=264148 RepID=UPI00082DCF4C|nr:LysR family transcriptional regulator [Millisia brevis]
MNLDLRRLEYFVAVAKNESYVRAAEQLHLTQPSLSRQIVALEQSLGVQLFTRDRRGTALTPAGVQLLEDAEPLIAAAIALERRVRAAARTTNEFTVGFMPGVPSTVLIAKFRAAHPDLTVDARYVPMVEQEPYLLDGTVDVSFVWLPLRSPDLGAVELFTEPRFAVVPTDAPQARAPEVALDDLDPLALIEDPATLPQWHGRVAARQRPFVAVEERLEAVAAGEGFSVIPEGIARYHNRPDVVAVRISNIPPAPVGLAYTRHRTMPEIASFARFARQLLAPP